MVRAGTLVDAELRRVIAYRSLLRPVVRTGDDRVDGEDVLPGLSLAVAELFEP